MLCTDTNLVNYVGHYRQPYGSIVVICLLPGLKLFVYIFRLSKTLQEGPRLRYMGLSNDDMMR